MPEREIFKASLNHKSRITFWHPIVEGLVVFGKGDGLHRIVGELNAQISHGFRLACAVWTELEARHGEATSFYGEKKGVLFSHHLDGWGMPYIRVLDAHPIVGVHQTLIWQQFEMFAKDSNPRASGIDHGVVENQISNASRNNGPDQQPDSQTFSKGALTVIALVSIFFSGKLVGDAVKRSGDPSNWSVFRVLLAVPFLAFGVLALLYVTNTAPALFI